MPTKDEIVKFYSEHADDPAAIAAAMKQYGVGAREASEALGISQQDFVAHVNSGGVATPVMPDFNNAPQLSADLSNAELSQIYQANNGDPAAVNKAIAARLTAPSAYGDYGSGNGYDPMTMADGIRRGLEQHLHTAGNRMSRDDFLKKYGTTFVADDKGGNAASEVAGQDVAEYYDKYLAQGAKGDLDRGSFDSPNPDGTYKMPDFGGGKYRDAHPYFDGWDNVNPHPQSQLGNGWDEAWKNVGRPIATAVAMYYGVGAIGGMLGGAGAAAGGTGGAAGIGSGTALGGATGVAAAPAASGLAGMMGMNSGMAATALNTGALNTGMSLARGNNIGDSLKTGVTSAALSPIGSVTSSGWYEPAVAAGKIALSGGNIGDAVKGAALSYAGSAAENATKGIIGGVMGQVAGGVVKGAVTGQDLVSSLASGVTSAGINAFSANIPGFDELGDVQKSLLKRAITTALRGKKITPQLIRSVMSDAAAAASKSKRG